MPRPTIVNNTRAMAVSRTVKPDSDPGLALTRLGTDFINCLSTNFKRFLPRVLLRYNGDSLRTTRRRESHAAILFLYADREAYRARAGDSGRSGRDLNLAAIT